MSGKPLPRSSIEALFGFILAIITVVFGMTLQLKVVLLFILIIIATDLILLSPLTIRWHWFFKAVLVVAVVSLIMSLSWKQIYEQWIKDHPVNPQPLITKPPPSIIPLTRAAIDAKWHIPTWVSPIDGTFVGQTQYRSAQSASLPDASTGNVIIALDTYNPVGTGFFGTDLISKQLFTLGQGLILTVHARMNAPIPAGIVGGIFLYAPPRSQSNTLHDEIDFQMISSDPNHVHTNIYGSEPLGLGHPASYPYPSGSITDAHTYQIQWLPNQVSWYVDDHLVRTVTTQSPIPVGPMYVHLNIWVPSSAYAVAYNPDLVWTRSPSFNRIFSISVASVTAQSIPETLYP